MGLPAQALEDAGEEAFGAFAEAPVVGLAVARDAQRGDVVLAEPGDDLGRGGAALGDGEARLAVLAAGVGGGLVAGGIGAAESERRVGIPRVRLGARRIARRRAFGQPVIGKPGGFALLGRPSLRCPAAGFDPGSPGRPESGLVGPGLAAADDFPEHGIPPGEWVGERGRNVDFPGSRPVLPGVAASLVAWDGAVSRVTTVPARPSVGGS